MALLFWSLKDLIEVIEGCVKNDFDVILVAEGKRGTGKSTLLYKIADRLGRRGVVSFSPYTSLVYSREDTMNLLAHKTKHIIFSDEMINVAYKRDFYEKEQKEIIKGLNMYRDSCNVFMCAVPDFRDLDGDMRKLTKIRLSVLRRGIAEVRIQPRFEDFLKANEITRKLRKDERQDIKMEPTKRIGLLAFKDLSPRQRETYRSIKMEKRGQAYGQGEDFHLNPMQDWYKKLYDQVLTKSLADESFCAIARMAGKKPSTVKARIGQMLRDEQKPLLSTLLTKNKPSKSVPEWDKL